MCIRDRDMLDELIKEALTREFDEYNQSLQIPEEEIEFSEEHKKKMEKPVSYTHLDVYKRQSYDSACNACRP